MKTKIKILLVSCVIASAAVTGFNMAQENSNMDVSLADIAVMARADGGESGSCPGGSCTWTYANGDKCDACCPVGKNPRCSTHGCECVLF